MSDSDRLLNTALRILAIAVLLIWGAIGVGLVGRDSPNGGARNHEAGQYQGEASPSATRLSREVCANAAQRSSDQTEQRAKDDLCAQFLAARAAQEGADAAAFQTIIGGVGLAFILATLIANVWATAAATRAVRDAREFYLGENRPWLRVRAHVYAMTATPDNSAVIASIRVTAQNVGYMPAINVHFEIPATALRTFAKGERDAFGKEIAEHKEGWSTFSLGDTIFAGKRFRRSARVLVPLLQTTAHEKWNGTFFVPLWVSYHFRGSNERHVTPVVHEVQFSSRYEGQFDIVEQPSVIGFAPD